VHQEAVGGVHRRGTHPDEHFVRTRHGLVHVLQVHDVERTVLVADDRLHATVLMSVSILTIVPCATATSMDSCPRAT
jgi:hypothetical protein